MPRAEDPEFYNTPEKAYVRDRWLFYTQSRAALLQASTIKYLTLPGVAYLDVRLLKSNGLISMLSPTQYNPQGLTFCESNKERFAKIRERLTLANSVFLKYEQFVGADQPINITAPARKSFPYDVINLDFQGPLLEPEGLLASVSKTILIQSQLGRSFTLFLTIKAVREFEQADKIAELETGLTSNLQNPETSSFRDEFSVQYPNFPSTPLEFHEFLAVALPKFLVKYGTDKSFDTSCRERYTYVGSGHTTRMLSLIMTYEYKGMIGLGDPPAHLTLRNSYPGRVRGILEHSCTDINQLLESSPEEKTRCFATVEANRIPEPIPE